MRMLSSVQAASAICMVAAFLAVLAGTQAAHGEAPPALAVVVNKARPESNLTRRELANIYLGEKKFWDGGNPLQPVLPPKSAPDVKDRFITLLTGLTPAEFGREWEGKVFRGESNHPPVILTTEKETVGYVYMIPNAIAVLPADSVAKYLKVIKVLSIDGKKPGDEGYGL